MTQSIKLSFTILYISGMNIIWKQKWTDKKVKKSRIHTQTDYCSYPPSSWVIGTCQSCLCIQVNNNGFQTRCFNHFLSKLLKTVIFLFDKHEQKYARCFIIFKVCQYAKVYMPMMYKSFLLESSLWLWSVLIIKTDKNQEIVTKWWWGCIILYKVLNQILQKEIIPHTQTRVGHLS